MREWTIVEMICINSREWPIFPWLRPHTIVSNGRSCQSDNNNPSLHPFPASVYMLHPLSMHIHYGETLGLQLTFLVKSFHRHRWWNEANFYLMKEANVEHSFCPLLEICWFPLYFMILNFLDNQCIATLDIRVREWLQFQSDERGPMFANRLSPSLIWTSLPIQLGECRV